MSQTMQIENTDLNAKWVNYNQTRLKGDKKTANKLLNGFVDALLKEEQDIIEKFVDNLCHINLDVDDILPNNGSQVSGSDNRIQYPLFRRVFIPVFVRKYKENNALYIRWIGQFEQFFYSDHSMAMQFLEDIDDELRDASLFDKETNSYKTVKCRYFLATHFFTKSYNIEPSQKTLDLLLERLAQDIFYATHELPIGILRDPDVFIEEVDNFKFYFEKANNKEKWEGSLHSWESIAYHWKTFTKEEGKYGSFEDYLNLNE